MNKLKIQARISVLLCRGKKNTWKVFRKNMHNIANHFISTKCFLFIQIIKLVISGKLN